MRKAIAFRIGYSVACMLAATAPAAFGQTRSETRSETRAEPRAEPRSDSGARSRVTLPFACAYDPATGRLRMTPAADQVYEITDRRDVQRATVCNPAGLCRPWLLHRFQMQCGAHRIAWMHVVAAVLATRPGQRTTIEDGRLVLSRALPVERGLRRRCFDRLAGTQAHRRLYGDGGFEECWHATSTEAGSARQWRIVLPPGFAPTRLISARIVPTPREAFAAAENAPAAPTSVTAPPPIEQQMPVAAEPVAGSTNEASASVEPAITPTAPAIAAPVELSTRVEAAPPAARQSAEATGSATPAAAMSLSDIAEKLSAQPYWTAGGVVLGLAALSWLRRRRDRPRTGIGQTVPALSQSLAGVRGPDVGAIEQLVGAAAKSLSHCRDCLETLPVSMPLRQVIARELHASVERLEKLAAEPHGTAAEVRRIRLRLQAITRELQRLSAIAEGALSSVGSAALIPVQLTEPRDRSEAYAVLGVNPDVEPRVLKKLVEALRQSWHPDQARDEADRRRREERIKQINVAWDIIQGRRVEA
jgi:hypothetical protein